MRIREPTSSGKLRNRNGGDYARASGAWTLTFAERFIFWRSADGNWAGSRDVVHHRPETLTPFLARQWAKGSSPVISEGLLVQVHIPILSLAEILRGYQKARITAFPRIKSIATAREAGTVALVKMKTS